MRMAPPSPAPPSVSDTIGCQGPMAPLQPVPPSSGNGGRTCLHPDGRGVIKASLLPPRIHSHHDSSLWSLIARGEVPHLALLSYRLPISQMGMLTEVE